MEPLPWETAYSIGVPDLDAQHQHMFDIANCLRTAMVQHEATRVLSDLLDALTSHSREHFAAEESAMAASGYLDYYQHRAVHEEFLAMMHGLRRKVQAGNAVVTAATTTFMGYWVRDHIMEMDQHLGRHLLATSAQNHLRADVIQPATIDSARAAECMLNRCFCDECSRLWMVYARAARRHLLLSRQRSPDPNALRMAYEACERTREAVAEHEQAAHGGPCSPW